MYSADVITNLIEACQFNEHVRNQYKAVTATADWTVIPLAFDCHYFIVGRRMVPFDDLR